MKLLAVGVTSLSVLALMLADADQTPVSTGDGAQTVEITRNGSQPSARGPAENFTGSVRIRRAPRGASVTFEPDARTAWHTHPAGQTLIVTAGLGWVQEWGGRGTGPRPPRP